MRTRRPNTHLSTTPSNQPETPFPVSVDAQMGRVVRAYGLFFDVRLESEPRTLLSTVRGSVKRARRATDLVAVGDRVWVKDIGENEGQIERIEPRVRTLGRLARHSRDVEQVIATNLDQVLFVFAWKEPEPHLRMLDRFLVLAESREIPAMIAINKIELEPDAAESARAWLVDYLPNYPVHLISVRQGLGIPELLTSLSGKLTAIAGPSGVGKSSLLNALDPTVRQQIGEISDATGKGRHTTSSTIIFQLDANTYVADTPGIRALALQGVTPEQLPACYPEFRPYLGECFYADCTHIHEPGCAVIAAISTNDISQERWDSYKSLRLPEEVRE